MKLTDQAERDLIATNSDRLLFVEAGAGTGKTTVLIKRIVSMVLGTGSFDPVPMSAIAAITFTEKAASELRNRVRAELNKALQEASGDGRDLVIAALSELDGAAVGTLHSFARRILAEHPVEAGLPPSFETLDEIASEVAFNERWDEYLAELLSDETMHWSIGMLDAAGVTTQHLRDLARAFNDNSDRMEWPEHLARNTVLDIARIKHMAVALLQKRSFCKEPTDCKLYDSFDPIAQFLDRLNNARNDRERFRELANAYVPKVSNKGRKDNWSDIATIRMAFDVLSNEITFAVRAVADEALAQVSARLRTFTVEGTEHRRRVGTLEFHDLLTQARWLLRDSPAAQQVRTTLAARYQRLMLDEFQDTDPIQIELARLIAFPDGIDAASLRMLSVLSPKALLTASPDGAGTASAQPERLFFVGDPKQSIYRFRRADIQQYRLAQVMFGEELGSVLTLRTNFRTLPSIINWVNEVFGRLITEVATLQPPYNALAAGRPLPEELRNTTSSENADSYIHNSEVPRVSILGLSPHDRRESIKWVREVESRDVAFAISEVMRERWTVIDPGTYQARAARPSDIAVLIPKRTCLPQLEDALSEAKISFRLEAASFVWRTQMVRDLMMCMRAISDPTDALAIASALRTPIYGCGDDDLYRHRVHHQGAWNYTDPRLSNAPSTPVVDALRHLSSLHRRKSTHGPAELLDALVRERRLYEQVATRSRPRDGWRQIRYLVDQARAWSDSQHGGLRGFLAWAKGQASENSRITESILPESDDEAVRVMTIHAAKGLEFPIVIVTGLQDKPRKRAGVQTIFKEEGSRPEIRLRGDVSSRAFDDHHETELEALHYERLRLLYVACTRARDHLIVSVHRKERRETKSADDAQPTQGEPRTLAQLQRLASKLAAEANPGHNSESGELLCAALINSDGSDTDEQQPGLTWRELRDWRSQFDLDAIPGGYLKNAASAQPRLPDTELNDWSADTSRHDDASAELTVNFASREEWLQRHTAAGRASRTVSNLSASALAKHHAAATRLSADPSSSYRGFTDRGHAKASAELEAAGMSKDDLLAESAVDVADAGSGGGFGIGATPLARRGRYGTSLGSAVHAVLQNIDIADTASHDSETVRVLAETSARDHGVPQYASEIVRRVQSALSSPTLAAAARGRYWQEVFVSAALPDGLVLEGFIDLLYETQAGQLVVVDFKTDSLNDGASIDQKTFYYRLQGATYAWCAQQATGMQVERIVFQFLTPEGLSEGVIAGDDLAAALEEVIQSAYIVRDGANVSQ